MGRPLGSIDKRHTESGRFARAIVDDPEYRKQLLERAIKGLLPPAVECLLYYYAFGRPVEHLNVSTENYSDDLVELSDEDLAKRAELIAQSLRRQLTAPKDDDNDDVH